MRKQFHWNVQLQRDDGQVVAFPISAYWDPEAEDTPFAVGNTAQAIAHVNSGPQGKRRGFAPVQVERVTEEV